MSKHLHQNMEEVKRLLLVMGGMVEEAMEKATDAISHRNPSLADEVINSDDAIDDLELKIEDECLKLLALYHPVAEDLRFVTTVLKINNDLERIADLASNMAERAKFLSNHTGDEMSQYFPQMAHTVIKMGREVLQAFIRGDNLAALQVCKQDDQIDKWHRTIIEELVEWMKESPKNIELAVQKLWISRNLERMADHIVNIAEDIVYMVEGETIRHKPRSNPSRFVTNH